MSKYKYNRFVKILSIILVVLVAFELVNFLLSEITDTKAYEDAIAVSEEIWDNTENKLTNGETLTDEDYQLIFSQTGLGKSAVEYLIENDNVRAIEEYRQYYLQDKNYSCVREGIFACHEFITNEDGEELENPGLANLENGDIIITLSIHSLGWRHGHAAIVTDAEKGITAQAVMVGEKSDFGRLNEWEEFPLVAVLRLKDIDENTQNEIALFASEKLIGINYALSAGVIGGGDFESAPFTTHCAHFVWYAYKHIGVDIDSNGGAVVTPKEILHSDKLEVVQVYGNIMDL